MASPALAQTDPAALETEINFGEPVSITIETADASHAFNVEMAITPEQMQRGLMWREELAADAGMLFSYDPVRPASMWMENTLVSLDLLYIDENGVVAKIIAYAQPQSRRPLPSDFPIAGVLEIAGGRSIELNIRPGAIVRHALFGNEITEETDEIEAPAANTTAEDAN